MIQFLVQVQSSGNTVLKDNSSGSVGDTPSSKSQAMLTMGDGSSYQRRLAVHQLGTPPRNLAI